jgi:hypothetical protein
MSPQECAGPAATANTANSGEAQIDRHPGAIYSTDKRAKNGGQLSDRTIGESNTIFDQVDRFTRCPTVRRVAQSPLT